MIMMKYLGIIVFGLLVSCAQPKTDAEIKLKGWGEDFFKLLEDRKLEDEKKYIKPELWVRK